MARSQNSFGTQVTLFCQPCNENLIFLNTNIVTRPVFVCPYCKEELQVTIVNIKNGTIREKYVGGQPVDK